MKLCLGASVLAVGVSLSTGVRAAPAPAPDELAVMKTRARGRIARPVTEALDELEETTVRMIERELLGRLGAAVTTGGTARR